jgi:hypothetical protein
VTQKLIISRLAKKAQQDGLTLQWSMIHLMEILQRNEQRIGQLCSTGSRHSETTAEQLRLETEALALVLEAVRQAYPAGTNVTVDA